MTDLETAAQAALANYRNLVEHNDQALPILLLLDTEDQLNVFGVQIPKPLSGAETLELTHGHMRSSGMPTMVEATFCNEAWLRHYDATVDGERGEELPMGEAVTCAAVTAAETVMLVQQFVRTKDGIRWEDVEQIPIETAGGDLIPALRKFVTAPA